MSSQHYTFWELIEAEAAKDPERVFAYFDDTPTTFGELRARVIAVANGVLKLGLTPGDRLAILTANCAEFADALFAAPRVGVLTVPVNTMFTGDFLVHPLRDSRAKAIIVDPAFIDRVLDVIDELPGLELLIVRSDELPTRMFPARVRVIRTSELYTGTADAVAGGQELTWKEPSGILYTSGTTGPSKGALVSQNYIITAARTLGEMYEISSADVVFGAMPLFHFGGMVAVLLMSLANGAVSVIDGAFSPTKCWERVRARRATVFMGVGPMVLMLFGLPPEDSDKELPLRLISSAPIPAELHAAIESRYQCPVRSVYALTEAFPLYGQGLHDTPVPGGSGQANPNFEIVLVDDDDEPVPTGSVGEVACRPRAPHIMYEGYAGLADVSFAQAKNLWFHTGDFGRLDESGNFAFVDRKKDAIRRRGENISSFEIEQVVMRHPAVVECAAHAAPSELGEDEVKICVILAPDCELLAGELIEHCAARMPKFAVPRYVEFVASFPKTATGRVQKAKLRENPLGPSTWDRVTAQLVTAN